MSPGTTEPPRRLAGWPRATALALVGGWPVLWPPAALASGTGDALPTDPGTPFAHWADWCARHPGARVRLWLGAQALLAVPLPDSLRGATDAVLRAQAQAQLDAWGGAGVYLSPAGVDRAADPAAAGLSLAPWRSAAGQGVLALDGGGWRAAAVRHRVRVLAARPACWPAVRALLRADAGLRSAAQAVLLLDEPGACTAVALRRGQIAALQMRQRIPADDADALAACREALGLAPEAPVHRAALWPLLAEAGLPRQPWPGRVPDFLDRGQPGLPAWAALAAAGVVLAVAGAEAAQDAGALAEALARAEAADQRWQSARARASDALRPLAIVAHPSAASSAPSDAEARAAQAALSRPWGEWLAAVEASTPTGVRWTRLDLTGARLRLEGEAGDRAQALDAAGRLGRQAPWGEVLLARLAVLGEAGRGVRFELQAREAAP